MKRMFLALTATVAGLMCLPTYAQDATEGDNLEYEKLKVLEPLIGTFHQNWTDEKTGEIRESEATISWCDSKKMLVVTGRQRAAKTEDAVARQPWKAWTDIIHYYWNNVSHQIESVRVRPEEGFVTVNTITPNDNGVFVYTQIKTSSDRSGSPKLTVEATDEALTLRASGRVDAEGKPLDDSETVYMRVK